MVLRPGLDAEKAEQSDSRAPAITAQAKTGATPTKTSAGERPGRATKLVSAAWLRSTPGQPTPPLKAALNYLWWPSSSW